MDKLQSEKLKSTAESFAGLSIGLLTVALAAYLKSGATGSTYFVVILGALFMVLSAYFALPTTLKQATALEWIEKQKIISFARMLSWLLVLLIFGINLFQAKLLWLQIAGYITVGVAYIVIVVGLWKIGSK
jgi:hypothetical protein